MGNPQGGSQNSKVSQRGLGGFPHERLANPEGVKSQKADNIGFPLILDNCAIDSVLY